MKQLLLLIAFGLAANGISTRATAQAISQERYPTKPIRFVVPFSPGGTADFLARILGEKLTPLQLAGGALIVVGVIGTGAPPGQARSSPSPLRQSKRRRQ